MALSLLLLFICYAVSILITISRYIVPIIELIRIVTSLYKKMLINAEELNLQVRLEATWSLKRLRSTAASQWADMSAQVTF